MQNKILIDIHAVTVREGIGRQSGKPYHIEEAAVMATTEYTLGDGQVRKDTMPGMVNLPDHLRGLQPGKYWATVGLGQFEGKVTMRIVDLTPAEAAARANVPPANAPKAQAAAS